MSNTNASEDNVESPSTYGREVLCRQHRKEEKKKKQEGEETKHG